MRNHTPVAVRFLPSLADLVFLAPIGFLCARTQGAAAMLGDGDTGWHLRTGEWILANGRVPYTDMFSFSKPGGTWFAWEWLWDAAFSVLHSWGGMPAVVLMSIAILSATFALVHRTAMEKSGNAVVSALVTLAAVAGSSMHWLARPHLVTLLFCILFFRILEEAKPRTLLYLLPVLMILWTNLHGGFVAGLILLGAYTAGEAFLYFLTSEPGERITYRARALVFAQSFGLCAAATFCNPYGYLLHQHVFSYLTDGYQMTAIAEFQSLSFHHPLSRFIELLLVLGFAAAFRNLVRGRFTQALLLFGWAHLGLVSARNLPIFAVIATPLIAEALQEWLQRLASPNLKWNRVPVVARRVARLCTNVSAIEALPRFHAVSVIAFALFGAVVMAPAPPSRFLARYDAHLYPEGALTAMGSSGAMGRIFTTDVWGGYLIYRKYPQVKVFVDGRSDYYGADFDTQYTDVLNVKPGWEARLREYGIDTVMVPADSFLSGALKESKNWRSTYDDGVAIVFRPVDKVPANIKPVSTALAGEWRNRKVATAGRMERSGSLPPSGKQS